MMKQTICALLILSTILSGCSVTRPLPVQGTRENISPRDSRSMVGKYVEITTIAGAEIRGMAESSDPFGVSVKLEDGTTTDIGWSEIDHIVIHEKSYLKPLALVFGSVLVLSIIGWTYYVNALGKGFGGLS